MRHLKVTLLTADKTNEFAGEATLLRSKRPPTHTKEVQIRKYNQRRQGIEEKYGEILRDQQYWIYELQRRAFELPLRNRGVPHLCGYNHLH